MKSLVLILFTVFSFIQNPTDVREQYYAASKSKQNADKFYNLLVKYNKENKTLLAYKGAALALKSKYTSDKKEKKELFIEGVTTIENSVKQEPSNAEIRLIRLSVQENTPKFLKYKANIEEDKKMILNSFEKQSKDLKEYIKIYVNQSKIFTEAEKQKIK
ncbi:hypothetical protein [Flavobacterium terrae]|uniref:Uncharacterized protein n=1 Tax=Flavobacterium terrae TaxID=415425 RepID=A0A1M6D3B8_9FLAO|nr:hypothetical protein [Flavobacterium terrae]SHI67564.1 hypothetical protein SAMN05444363_1224 [Flavobacterium terrae]